MDNPEAGRDAPAAELDRPRDRPQDRGGPTTDASRAAVAAVLEATRRLSAAEREAFLTAFLDEFCVRCGRHDPACRCGERAAARA